jgi:hypothetical protein
LALVASRQAFVAMRYSHDRKPVELASKLSRLRHAQEGLLHEILRLVEGAEHPVAAHVQLPPVALDELGELGH